MRAIDEFGDTKQVVNMIFLAENRADCTFREKRILDDSGSIKRYGKRYSVVDVPFVPRTREEIEKDFDKDIEVVSHDTQITFELLDEEGNEIQPCVRAGIPNGREILPLNYINPQTGQKLSKKNWNIIESHEKGHMLRTYNTAGSRENGFIGSRILYERFMKCFDLSAIVIPQKYYERFRKDQMEAGVDLSSMTDEMIRDQIFLPSIMNPIEITERMSQLKNYFGLGGIDKFTKEHLAYAREHYIKDTNFDNSMTQFFQAITPEKEDAFIELINSAGI